MTGKTTRIPVSPPLQGHGGAVHEVVLREPTFRETLDIGKPFVIQFSEAGIGYIVEFPSVIAQYARLLIVEPDALIVEQGGHKLALQVTRAIISFFLDSDEEAAGSKTLPTSSSSSLDKAASPSAGSPSANSSTGTAAPSSGQSGVRNRPLPPAPPKAGTPKAPARHK